MHWEIDNAADEVQRAQEKLRSVISRIRESCRHDSVVENPWHSYEYLGGCSNARRICTNCGYEEEGSHWSGGLADADGEDCSDAQWSQKDFKKAILGKREGRKVISSKKEFFQFRV